MNIQTAFRIFSIPAVFGLIAFLTALLGEDIRGWYALLLGLIVGWLVAKLQTPSFLRQWARTGVPGEQKTPEQQKQWEQEKGKIQIRRNLSIVIFGVIGAAIVRNYFRETLPFFIPATSGAVAVYLLQFIWLIYRERGRLGPEQTGRSQK
jgi:hypothetical protein